MSNHTITIPFEEHTPKTIHPDVKRICYWNGRYHRALETKDFIYFVNYQEGDENGCVAMYRKDGMELASDNYFAYNSLFELIEETPDEITYVSPTMKNNIKLHREANAVK